MAELLLNAKSPEIKVATQSSNGLMSSSDKRRLDGIISSPISHIETGTLSGYGAGWCTVNVTFTTHFSRVPFVIIQKTFSGATTEDWSLQSVSTTGFSANFYFSGNFSIGGNWIAIE